MASSDPAVGDSSCAGSVAGSWLGTPLLAASAREAKNAAALDGCAAAGCSHSVGAGGVCAGIESAGQCSAGHSSGCTAVGVANDAGTSDIPLAPGSRCGNNATGTSEWPLRSLPSARRRLSPWSSSSARAVAMPAWASAGEPYSGSPNWSGASAPLSSSRAHTHRPWCPNSVRRQRCCATGPPDRAAPPAGRPRTDPCAARCRGSPRHRIAGGCWPPAGRIGHAKSDVADLDDESAVAGVTADTRTCEIGGE